MRILVYTDNHWCQYSSILRQRGEKYSLRIENQIKSINWAEQLAVDTNCSMIVHCGDFFDKDTLNAEELSALNDLKFVPNIEHYILVGNHEMGINTLEYSSAHVLSLSEVFTVIDSPKTMELDDFHQLCFLPYVLEENRKPLEEVFQKTPKKRIIFSHNDIAGIQLGKFVTVNGYSIEEIENNCDLFINGHIHNGSRISSKIYNVGNLTGQNFSEDGFNYHHSAFVINTDTLQIDVYDNPFAVNFYKIDFTENDSIDYINDTALKLRNAVVTIQCNEQGYSYLKKRFGAEKDPIIPHCDNVLASKFIIKHESKTEDIEERCDLSVNHIDEFKNFVLSNIGSDEVILSELQEILK